MPRKGRDGQLQAEALELLVGSDYYRWLPRLFRKARKSIHLCMFHIAMPSPKHPTRRLLRALVAAHRRGVSVRVLMDYDRKRDPYLSRVVNKAAMDYLRDHKVRCRFDKPEKLLHSKFVTVDAGLTVIGSHNWSAGSYFRYGDVSLAIRSVPYTRHVNGRFRDLWKRGSSEGKTKLVVRPKRTRGSRDPWAEPVEAKDIFGVRARGTNRRGEPFSPHVVQAVWDKARQAPGYDPKVWRRDPCNALIKRDEHGNTSSKNGWEVDHIRAVAMGGLDALSNLQALQWEHNREKGDEFPWSCP